MAAYISYQNGDFNDSATWGASDFPNANSGTITDGFGNSQIYGHLKHTAGMVTELRMNGNLDVRTNGLYEMVDDSTLVFKGTNADDHGLNVYNEAGASMIATGTTPTLETYITESGDVGQAYYTVNDSTNLQTGDWCSVFFRYTELKSNSALVNNTGYPTGPLSGDGVNQSRSSWEHNDQNHNEPAHSLDAGFIIHDISAAQVYPRHLVGPEATITSAAGNRIKVDDSRVFRIGQTLIFGRSSTRNVLVISDINNNLNQITFTSNLSSTNVVGQTVYLGGWVNNHYARSKFRRVASMVAVKAAKDATTITLNEASDFAVGDSFYADHVKTDDENWDQLLPNDGDTWKNDTNKRHLVTAKSGNTLTFTPALPHVVAANTFVYKANRKITIKAQTIGTDKPYFYMRNTTTQATIDGQSRYNRKMVMKDVQFLGFGNSSSGFPIWFRGGANDGYWRYSHSLEGIVIDGMGNTESYYIRFDSHVYAICRNWIVANYYRGGYTGNIDNQIFNCVYLNCRRSNENRYVYYHNGRYWFNRCVRIFDYDYVRSPAHWGGIITHHQNYYNGEHGIYVYGGQNHYQSHFIVRFRPIRAYTQDTDRNINYCKLENINQGSHDDLYFENGNDFYRYNAASTNQIVAAKDYILGNDWIYSGGVAKVWDEQEAAYRVYGPLGAGYNDPEGSWQEIIMPPNSTARVTAEAKLPATTYSNGTSWSFAPHLLYYLADQGILHRNQSYSNNWYESDFYSESPNNIMKMAPNIDVNWGGNGRFDFDSASQTDSYQNTPFTSKTQYNSKTVTITNDSNRSRTLRVGLLAISTNAREGWYEKPIRIALTKQASRGERDYRGLRSIGSYIFKIGVSTVNNIKRIGGSRI